MRYEALFSPVRIGSLTLENRIVSSAIHLMYTQEEDLAGDRLVEYYRRRAGGVGLMIVGGCAVDSVGHSEHMLSLARADTEPGLARLTAAVHAGGGRVAAQLYHAGRYAHSDNNGGAQPIAPSPIPSSYTGQTPREMGGEDIRHVVDCFCAAARRARRVGFDAVELIGSAGYLICQFFSPLTNRRSDGYGGCFEGRCRFGRELVEAVRRAVGPDYPILVRLSGSEFMKGGSTNREIAAFARVLEEAGADAIHVTGGWHETLVPQVSGEVPPGAFSYLAAGIRRAVSIPVIASNRVNDPDVAETILRTGAADLVNMGRALLVDPDFAVKLRQGREAEARRCIGCGQGCMDRCFSGLDVRCILNPFSGREGELTVTPAPQPKNLLVVGAGPAGMEFAAWARRRGHRVTVWEGSDRVGGAVNLAAVPPGKGDFASLIAQQRAVLEALGVPLLLGRKATAGDILAEAPDEVILATGALPRPAPFPVEAGADVVPAGTLLGRERMAGQRVVIVGGGAVGCETALCLAEEATPSPETIRFLMAHRAESPEVLYGLIDRPTRDLTIVEYADRIGAGIGKSTRWAVKKNLKRLGVRTLARTQVLRAGPGMLLIRDRDTGAETQLEADTVVLAIGSQPDPRLYAALEGHVPVHLIGDAVKARTLAEAIGEAVELALKI